MIISSFKQSLKFAPKVLKDSTLYFGLYFFAFSLIVLALFKNLSQSDILNSILLFLSALFTVFIIPYYAFKYSQGTVPKFWDFIRDNIWPVALSHIKAFFVILLFAMPSIVAFSILAVFYKTNLLITFLAFLAGLPLLILPFYKNIRFSFLTETVLFDKQKQKSFLKQADSNTRGFFWKLILLFILSGLFSFVLGWSFKKILTSLFGSSFFTTWLSLILLFYLQCFYLLWKINLFFKIKKQKGEELSCYTNSV